MGGSSRQLIDFLVNACPACPAQASSQTRGIGMSGVRCQVSGVRCQMSGVRCQVSDVRCQMSGVRCKRSNARAASQRLPTVSDSTLPSFPPLNSYFLPQCICMTLKNHIKHACVHACMRLCAYVSLRVSECSINVFMHACVCACIRARVGEFVCVCVCAYKSKRLKFHTHKPYHHHNRVTH